MKIMLADDEESVGKLVEHIVRDCGHEFCLTTDGESALRMFEEENPDLLILDIVMPGMDGYQVCRALREGGSLTPIMFLSARGEIYDKSIGFKAGGDDYLAKPFSAQELALRIEAHLRRELRRDAPSRKESFSILGFDFDVKKKRVMKGGERIELTPKEFGILLALASSPGEVFTQEQLIEAVWGKEYIGTTGSVAVFIRKIREKIEENPTKPRYVQTVWREGYRFGD